MTSVARTVLAAALLALASASPAAAGVAQVELEQGCGKYDNCWYRAAFDAVLGEANRLVVTSQGNVVRFADGAAPVQPGERCTADGEQAAECRGRPLYPYDWARASTNDGDDAVDWSGYRGWVTRTQLGPGDDRLVGSPRNDTVFTGPGADVLDAGAGDDELIHAGVGPIAVDLASGFADDGEGRDAISGFEDVRGGPADDVLTGDGGDNELDGWTGGSDRFTCGGGDDLVRVAPGAVGAGAHRVAPDCELVAIDHRSGLHLPGALATPKAAVVSACDDCKRSIVARAVLPGGERAIGRARAGAALELSRAGRRLLRRRGPLDVRLSVSQRRLAPADHGSAGALREAR